MMNEEVVSVTGVARAHIVSVLKKMDKPYLVFGLKGGGCAGFEYFWQPADQELYQKNGDPSLDLFISLEDGKTLIVDNASLKYVNGSTIDYNQDFVSSNLVVVNPNAAGGCGCNKSVSF